ncbi:carbon-nitrogen hydrolase family protein [Humitalea sp. 24SJ18S-53]|uniref:carbon-nitrogen hydrolase family protein n=1 Tax=Humitalea sp. 24SJ18S-53 TaxID=3422307 RepID=UPI003D66CEFA
MRVTAIQMNPGHDKATNLLAAERLIESAVAADRPDMVVLPEIWTCLGGDRATRFAAAEVLGADPNGAYALIQTLARKHGIFIHGGSIGEDGGEKLFNTTVAFGRDGRELARYRKIHMFDITRPDGTGHRESNTYRAGSEVVTYQAEDLTIGCAICYDVRFPELFLDLRRRGADVIMLPAAFTLATGKDHWDTLLRARAIETQSWLVAPATWGRHAEPKGPRETYGHSLICDPWGHVVARASDGVGFVTAPIDNRLTARIRRDMPVLEHRRLVPGEPAASARTAA